MKAARQLGVSLVELLIGMVVSLLVLGGAVAIYSNTGKSHGDTMQSMQLAQNMRAALAVMQREIAHAGYAGDQPGDLVLNNPFFSTTTASSTDMAVYNSGSCIVFAYNRDNDSTPVVDDNERLGFRLSANTVQMRIGGNGHNNDCAGSGWESILADDIDATALSFTLTMNAVNPNGQACAVGDICVYLRKVAINFSARLAEDASVTHTLHGSVQVRNHKVTQL